MQSISSISQLKNQIQILEVEQSIKGRLLKDQFLITYESLKPINLLKSTLKDVATSPYLIDNILGNAIGLASGYLSRKIVVGASSSIIRKILGSVLQFGVTNLVSQHPEAIKNVGRQIFQKIFRKKEINPDIK